MQYLSEAHQLDLVFIVLAFLIGAGSVILTYWIAGQPWREEFPLIIQDRDVGGEWGEIFLLFVGLFFLFVIDIMTPETSMFNMVMTHKFIAASILLVVFLLVLAHRYNILYNAFPKEKGEYWDYVAPNFKSAYIAYVPWMFFVFLTIIAAAILLSLQAYTDYQALEIERAVMRSEVQELAGIPNGQDAEIGLGIERVYNATIIIIGKMISLANALFLGVIAVVGLHLLIFSSPLRTLYTKEGHAHRHYVTIGSVLVVVAYCGVLYFQIYLGTLTEAREAIVSAGNHMTLDNWQLLQRFNEVSNDLQQRKGVVGFFGSLLRETGSIAFMLWLIDAFMRTRPQTVATISPQYNETTEPLSQEYPPEVPQMTAYDPHDTQTPRY